MCIIWVDGIVDRYFCQVSDPSTDLSSIVIQENPLPCGSCTEKFEKIHMWIYWQMEIVNGAIKVPGAGCSFVLLTDWIWPTNGATCLAPRFCAT